MAMNAACLRQGEHPEHDCQIGNCVPDQEQQLNFRQPTAAAEDRLHAGHVQPQPLEEQHEGKERSLQAIPQTDPCRSGLTRCSDAERDQTRPDVRVPPHLVGVRVMRVVLGHPPSDAQPGERVADRQADEPVDSCRTNDLLMTGIMAEKDDLSEQDGEKDGDTR